jgi:hypothetical protein
MSYTEDGYNQAKSDMLGDLNKAITDAADLRKSETEAADDAVAAAREASVEQPASTGAVPGCVLETPAGNGRKNGVTCPLAISPTVSPIPSPPSPG